MTTGLRVPSKDGLLVMQRPPAATDEGGTPEIKGGPNRETEDRKARKGRWFQPFPPSAPNLQALPEFCPQAAPMHLIAHKFDPSEPPAEKEMPSLLESGHVGSQQDQVGRA